MIDIGYEHLLKLMSLFLQYVECYDDQFWIYQAWNYIAQVSPASVAGCKSTSAINMKAPWLPQSSIIPQYSSLVLLIPFPCLDRNNQTYHFIRNGTKLPFDSQDHKQPIDYGFILSCCSVML